MIKGVVVLATCKGKDLMGNIGIPKTKKEYKIRKWITKIKAKLTK